jgi:hypothetical protein
MSSRPPILVALAAAFAWPTAGADSSQLDAAVLKKVKAATVHLEVSLLDGSTAEGSGFFTDEPGVVVTNAHVLGMLNADSRPPLKVAVTLNSGEADSRTLPGKLLGVDRDSDLALLRVTGPDMPEALKVVPAKDLVETAEVYIFGFPLGKRLGKNITVSKSSVSSLRKENGRLKEVQVNGGMHTGNSGGPVVNGKGEVVGVAVAVIRGTQINFAVPGEAVQGFLGGKIVGTSADLGYKDGDKVKMAFRLSVVDPLGRIKKITLDTWTGERGTGSRPPNAGEPKMLPGDSERQVVAVKYERQPTVGVELTLPPLDDPKKAYWVRASFVNGAGQTVYRGAWAPNLGPPVERKEITLRYRPRLDRAQQTELMSEGSFRLLLENEEHSLALNSRSLLAERTAAARAGDALPIHFDIKNCSLSLLEDKKPLKTSEDMKRHAANLRQMSADLEMAADGAVARSTPDVSRVPSASQRFAAHSSDQLLQGLELLAVPLPQGALKPLQSWKVRRTVLLGPTGADVKAQTDIQYTYMGTRLLNGREIAFLDVKGTLKGVRGNGLNVGGTVGGGAQVALDTGEVLSATMDFKADMDLEIKDTPGKLQGTLTVRLRRDFPPPEKPRGE